MLHLWWNHLLFSVDSHTLLPLFIHPCLLFIRVPGRWIQFGMACGQTFVCPSSLNRCLLPIRSVGDGRGGRNKPWQVASPSPCSLAVGVPNLMSLSVAADVAIKWYWKDVKALGIQPGTSLWCPSCKNTNGSIWLPSCMIIETFSVQTVSLSVQRWLRWLAGWQLSNDKICMPPSNGVCCWHDSRRRGGWGERVRPLLKREGEQHGKESWQTESALSFHQCNSWLLGDQPPACQAERISSRGRAKRKNSSDGNNKGLKAGTNVRIDRPGEKQKLRWV